MALIKESNGKLNNGEEYLIRNITLEDSKDLLEHFQAIVKECEFLVSTYREAKKITLESEKTTVLSFIEGKNIYYYTMFVNNKIVACSNLTLMTSEKTSHRALVGIGVRQSYYNKGCGKILFNEMINQAKKLKLEQIDLEYIDGNERGKYLYKKLGFKETGRIPNAFKIKGKGHDAVYMTLNLI